MYRKLRILILTASIIPSCKGREAAQLKHAEGGLKPSPGVLWHRTTPDQYKEARKVTNATDKIEILTGQDQEEISTLVARLDKSIRTKYPQMFKAVPFPKVQLISDINDGSPNVNAWVEGIFSCVAIPLYWSADKTLPVSEEFINITSSKLSTDLLNRCGKPLDIPGVRAQPLMKKNLSYPEAAQYFDWRTENYYIDGKKGCQISVEKDSNDKTYLRVNKLCSVPSDLLANYSGAQGVIIPQTSIVISVTNELRILLSDNQKLAATIAHELSHYYLSHPLKDSNGYFYDPEQYNGAEKPKPINTYEGWEPSIMNVEYAKQTTYTSTIRLNYNPFLFDRLSGVIRMNICGIGLPNARACPASCQVAQKYYDKERDLEWRLPTTDSDVIKELVQYDKLVKECANDFEFISKRDTPLDRFFAGDFDAVVKDLLKDDPFVEACASPNTQHKSLDDLLTDVTTRLATDYCDPGAVREKISNHKLGWYTLEQEADDMSLEILFLAGFPVTDAIDTELLFAKLAGDEGCIAWKKKMSGRNIPLLENYADPHHSPCFRLENIKNEMTRHDWIKRQNNQAK